MSTLVIAHPLTGELAEGLSLELPETLVFADWTLLGERLCNGVKVVNWWIGDWWAFGGAKYGERAKAAAEGIFGREFQTLVNVANVSRKFESNRRRLDVPWSHHAEVAALPADEADALLDKVKAENWSKRDLRQAIKELRVIEAEEAEPDDDIDNNSTSPQDYRTAFLLRTDQCTESARQCEDLYKKAPRKAAKELLAAARQTAAAWEKLAQHMEKS